MSARPKLKVLSKAPANEWPLTTTERTAFGALLGQRQAVEQQIQSVFTEACVSHGIAVGTQGIEFDAAKGVLRRKVEAAPVPQEQEPKAGT